MGVDAERIAYMEKTCIEGIELELLQGKGQSRGGTASNSPKNIGAQRHEDGNSRRWGLWGGGSSFFYFRICGGWSRLRYCTCKSSGCGLTSDFLEGAFALLLYLCWGCFAKGGSADASVTGLSRCRPSANGMTYMFGGLFCFNFHLLCRRSRGLDAFLVASEYSLGAHAR